MFENGERSLGKMRYVVRQGNTSRNYLARDRVHYQYACFNMLFYTPADLIWEHSMGEVVYKGSMRQRRGGSSTTSVSSFEQANTLPSKSK